MTRRVLEVRAPGLLTTVQDLGRNGWQHLGVPVGGAMDVVACRAANRLVGNDEGAAVIEATLTGPVLIAHAPLTVAITGASFDAAIDGVPWPANTPRTIPRGATLTLGEARRGARAYLAVAGGIDTPQVLGSRATTPGLLGGRALKQGDLLPVGLRGAEITRTESLRHRSLTVPMGRLGRPADPPIVRVVAGPDLDGLGPDVLARLCSAPFTVDPASNRMGYRLAGPALDAAPLSPPSSGTVMGMIQLPPSGHPLLLMADRQTTGGYPVPALVIGADLGIVAQLAPGDRCQFAAVTRAQAVAARLGSESEWPRG